VVFTHTTNHQQFHPEVAPPYSIALIELAEQSGLRIVANVVDCRPESVRTGMRVEVRLERRGPRFVPVATPSALELESESSG
jgi:uncharacterized protein